VSRALPSALLCAAFFAGALHSTLAAAATPDACAALRKHGKEADAHACYTTLSQQRDPYLRAEGYWGLKMYQDANAQFRLAVAQSNGNALYRVRWGRLLHERFKIPTRTIFSRKLCSAIRKTRKRIWASPW